MIRVAQAARAAVVMALLVGLSLIAPATIRASSPSVAIDKSDIYARRATLVFSDVTDTGALTVTVSCDNLVHDSDPYAYTNPLRVSLVLPGCEGYGVFDVWVTVRDGAAVILQQSASVPIAPQLTLVTPLPAITGHLFTIDPTWPADFTPTATVCRWEFRWGDDRSLDQRDPDETYGDLLFDIKAVNGDCPEWTFNLPWVPYRQYDVDVSAFTPDGTGEAGDARLRFSASVDGTGQRITTSTLPIAQVLPSTYTPIVGQPVTYTRYLVGGATAGTSVWTARQGSGERPTSWEQWGGSTFTITPHKQGDMVVGWDKMSGQYRLGAVFDPPVRYRDLSRPNTTSPVQRIRTGALGDTVLVSITWDGSDRGWGIARYQLERSVDGGAWKRILSKKVKHLDQSLATGHRYRYRVRAVDKAGNRGAWDYGPRFRPRIVGDSATAVRYAGTWSTTADAAAAEGSLHESDTAAAKATFRFTGRDVAWLAQRGPGHGKAKVYVDGVLATIVDLAAASDTPPRIVFHKHFRARASQAVRIVVVGTAGRPTVDVDGFVVLR